MVRGQRVAGSGATSPERLAFTSQGLARKGIIEVIKTHSEKLRPLRLFHWALARWKLKLDRAPCHPGSSGGAVRLTKGRRDCKPRI